MRVFIAFAFIISITGFSFAQSQFQITVGGPGGESPNSIIRTSDGGYAIAGSTNPFSGVSSIYVTKLNAAGSMQWSKTLSNSNVSEAYSIYQTIDAGYIITGYVILNSNYRNVYLAKLDSSGNLQWNKSVQQNTTFNAGMSVIQTADGGYAVAEFENGDFQVVLKFSSSGTLQWNKVIEGAPWNLLGDLCSVIKQTSDGGYILGSSTNSFGAGGYDFYLVKLDSTGSLIWAKTVGGPANEILHSMIQTADGSIILSGTTFTFGAGNWDMYLVKLSSAGDLIWTRTIGATSGTSTDKGYGLVQTSDGGYAVATCIGSIGMCIAKLDSAGTLLWAKGTNHYYNTVYLATPLVLTSDGGLLMGGITGDYGAGNSDIYLVKFDASGNNCGTILSPVVTSGSGGTIMSQTPQIAPAILTVVTPSMTIGSVGVVTTVCPLLGANNNETELPHEFMLYQNYPNPFNPSTKIKFDIPAGIKSNTNVTLAVYDVSGKVVSTLVNEQLKTGTYEAEWNAASFSSGVYFYKLTVRHGGSSTGDFVQTKRMVLVK